MNSLLNIPTQNEEKEEPPKASFPTTNDVTPRDVTPAVESPRGSSNLPPLASRGGSMPPVQSSAANYWGDDDDDDDDDDDYFSGKKGQGSKHTGRNTWGQSYTSFESDV